ncbi:MAG: polysaccharide deacetylase family protein [Candidatus Falkowbacteria bacterium]
MNLKNIKTQNIILSLLVILPVLFSAKISLAATTTTDKFCLTVPILMYHHVEPTAQAKANGQEKLYVDSDIFAKQMEYFKKNSYHSISTEELIAALRTGKKLPKKTIVITLDDGYQDNYDYAFPVAKKYGLIINIMVPTGLLESSGYLSWGEVLEMAASNLVFFYNHTDSHFPLAQGKKSKVLYELNLAQDKLQKALGYNVPRIITYPYGDYNSSTIKIAQADSFIAGLTTKKGNYQCSASIMELHRQRIGNTLKMREYYGL